MNTRVNAMLQFGLVTLPVGIAPAVTGTNQVSFKTLHEKCRQPVKITTVANKTRNGNTDQVDDPLASLSVVFCEHCKEPATETVKGFEFTKGQFVTFTEDEIEAAKGGRVKTINISKFVKQDEVKATLVDTFYFLVPNAHVDTAYGLLYQSLVGTKMAGIGRQSLWGKETPCAIIADQSHASGGVLMMVTLHCHEDLVEPDFAAPIPSAEAKKLAKEMILLQTGTLTTNDLESGARVRLQDMIKAKMEGVEVAQVAEREEPAATIDIIETLKASIAEMNKAKKKPAAKPRTRKAA